MTTPVSAKVPILDPTSGLLPDKYTPALATQSATAAAGSATDAVNSATAAAASETSAAASAASVKPGVPGGVAQLDSGGVVPVAQLGGTTPRKIVISSDFYTDCDDVGAMRVARKCESAGLFDVMAVVVDTVAYDGAPAMDALWRQLGRQVQVGQLPYTLSDLSAGGPYQADLMTTFPHYGDAATDFPPSTTVLRTALAAADDNSVTVVAIGYSNALEALLESDADSISTLTGTGLVAAKVHHLFVMGGKYPSGTENNFSRSPSAIAAAAYLVQNWPGPTGWTATDDPYVTFLGYEAGLVTSGQDLALTTPRDDAVTLAYRDHGSVNGNNSWDLLTTLLAAQGADLAGYTTVRGTNAVDMSTGANTFTASSGGPHEYVVEAQTAAWYAARLSELLAPDRIPTWLNEGGRIVTGLRPGASMPVVVGTSVGTPSLALRAADLTGLSDGASITSVAAVGTTTSAFTTNAGNEPTYAASKGGSAAIAFNGDQWFRSSNQIGLSIDLTVYARVWFDTLPTANQTIVSRDIGNRDFHLTMQANGVPMAASFNNGTGFTDTTTPNVTTGAWHVIVLRRTAGMIEVLLDGSTDGPSNHLTAVTANGETVIIGAATVSGSGSTQTPTEPLTAWVSELRVYPGYHSIASIAAISADLT